MSTKVFPVLRTKSKSVRRLLLLLSIPPWHNGYTYLQLAVLRYAGNPTQSMTKELYPDIAGITGAGSGAAVERNIRYSIAIAWEHRDPEVWHRYFPYRQQVPTNKQFIAALAERIK